MLELTGMGNHGKEQLCGACACCWNLTVLKDRLQKSNVAHGVRGLSSSSACGSLLRGWKSQAASLQPSGCESGALGDFDR